MKVTLLGTGSPVPMLNRASSGYLVEFGDEMLVFDHGAGAQQAERPPQVEAARPLVQVRHHQPDPFRARVLEGTEGVVEQKISKP